MRIVHVRYKVKPEAAAENERLSKEVYAELERKKPAGLRYETFKLPDGVTFVHLGIIDAPEGENPLTSLDSFKAFTADIKSRCAEPPVNDQVVAIGRYAGSR